MVVSRASLQWSATIPGSMGHAVIMDPACRALYVGDGWGTAYRHLGLAAYDLESGEALGRALLRDLVRGGLVLANGRLLVATFRGLFELERPGLRIVRRWADGVPRYMDALAECESGVLMANWRAPTLYLFDLKSGTVVWKRRLGPTVRFLHVGQTWWAGSGHDGTLGTLDPATGHRQSISRGIAPYTTLFGGPADTAPGAVLAGPLYRRQGVMHRDPTPVIARWQGVDFQRVASLTAPVADVQMHAAESWCLTGRPANGVEVLDATRTRSRVWFRVADHGVVGGLDPDGRRVVTLTGVAAGGAATLSVRPLERPRVWPWG